MQTLLTRPAFTVLRPTGHLNAANVHEFRAQLQTALSAPDSTALLVDLEQVEFLDSAGLISLVSGLKQAQTLNRQFSLCAVNPAVRMVLELSQLDRVFEIYENATTFEGQFTQA